MATINSRYPTREQWLLALDERLDELFKNAGRSVKPKMRMSCGFPSTRPRISSKGYSIGECWHAESSRDGTHELFVSPVTDDPFRVAEILIHERCHAYQEPQTGHRAPFARLARAVGLEGKPTKTELSPQLRKWLEPIIEALGPYPHAAVNATARKKQTTRLILITCQQCGMKFRTTSMWLEMIGPPTCRCGGEVEIGDAEDDVVSLQTVEMMLVYETNDSRFEVKFIKDRLRYKRGVYFLVDHEAPLPDGTVTTRLHEFDSRGDCIDMIDAIHEGLYEYSALDEHEPEDGDFVPDDEYEELDDFEGEDKDEYPEVSAPEPPSIITAERDDFDMAAAVREHRERMRERAG